MDDRLNPEALGELYEALKVAKDALWVASEMIGPNAIRFIGAIDRIDGALSLAEGGILGPAEGGCG